MSTVVVPQLSLAVGVSKFRLPMSRSVVLLAEQEMVGRVVSTVAMVWLQVLVLPHWSVATQVRVATKVLPQDRKSVVLGKRVDFGGRRIIANNESKVRLPMLHSLVLLSEQLRV